MVRAVLHRIPIRLSCLLSFCTWGASRLLHVCAGVGLILAYILPLAYSLVGSTESLQGMILRAVASVALVGIVVLPTALVLRADGFFQPPAHSLDWLNLTDGHRSDGLVRERESVEARVLSSWVLAGLISEVDLGDLNERFQKWVSTNNRPRAILRLIVELVVLVVATQWARLGRMSHRVRSRLK